MNTCRYCIWSVFPGARHLNLMDKIRLHVIQMNLNSWSLNSRVSDSRASDSEVSEASDSEVLNSSPWSWILPSWIRDLGLEVRGLRYFWTLTFLGFDLGWWTIGPNKGCFMTQQGKLLAPDVKRARGGGRHPTVIPPSLAWSYLTYVAAVLWEKETLSWDFLLLLFLESF